MSGGERTVRGVVTGTGASLDVRTVGFRPTKVVLRNATSNIMLEWVNSQADAAGFKTLAAGTRTNITSAGITPLSNGFNVGTDSVNTAAQVIHYEATN
jgi:hypothetical protein